MEYIVDLVDVRTREELHDRLLEWLPLPDYYGRNLDAFHDFLTEQTEPAEITFLIDNITNSELNDYIRRLKIVCEDAQTENEALTFYWQML